MQFLGAAVTDVGISKKTNQDSVCVKVAETKKHGQVAMVVLCDGMGGLDKGELASAAVIRAFSNWFENELPIQIDKYSLKSISAEWEKLAKEQNYLIGQYGKKIDVSLGTTLTAMLLIEGKYLIVHIGDSRAYLITDKVEQLTEDQTFINREVKAGRMTPEEAKLDPRRNMLLQCVGASKTIEPQIITGKIKNDSVYMFCSDGFRHVLSDKEIYENFNFVNASTIQIIEQNAKYLIETVKSRQEKDNITVAVLKCIG
ncbi:MAG: PP2C family protein-serine/threonine phosphatase [Eubacterium sp.]